MRNKFSFFIVLSIAIIGKNASAQIPVIDPAAVAQSVLVSFDLERFGGFMPIISSSKDSIKEIENIIEELGTDDPDVWLPIYQERILSKGGL